MHVNLLFRCVSLAALAGLLCAASGCGSLTPEATLPSAAATGNGPVRIAAIFGKSGAEAASGEFDYRGAKLAVDIINRQGGLLGRQIELVELDNQSVAAGSREAAGKASAMGVLAVIGGDFSDNSLAMAPVLQRAGILMIAPISTDPALSQIGDCIFRVCFNDSFQGKIMAYYSRQELGAQTAAILTRKGCGYSRTLTEWFTRYYTQNGGRIVWEGEYGYVDADGSAGGAGGRVVWEGEYAADATDFTAILKKIKELKPDVVFVPGYEKDSSLIIKQAREAGLTQVFLGGDGWNGEMLAAAGAAVDGSYFVNHWHQDADSDANRRFLQEYRAVFGEKASVIPNAALAFDAVMVLGDAVRRAQSFDRARVKASLLRTSNFEGATGMITFDKSGDPKEKDAFILKFDSGKVRFLKAIWEKKVLR